MNKLLLIIIFILFLLVFFLLIYIIKDLNKGSSNVKELELQSKLDEANNENEHLKALLDERINELNELRSLNPIGFLMDENLKSINLRDIDSIPVIEPEINTPEISPSSKISQYYTVPGANGTFNPLHAKDFDDGNCHYKIEFSEFLNSTGVLSYISSNRDRVAIHAFNDYLTSVCDIENFSNRSIANNIQMTSSGTVNLGNDLWFVDNNNKVKIRFT